jgi:4-amino-4-deoxy-L-arabinose transferase-like glycosyltransferase
MPFGEIVITYESENQHFLYSLLAHASFQLFGESAWALRLPAVLFGVGSIGALYLLGREVANKSEALLSAALLTFSYQHVWFSQNARGYTGLLFWTILSSWLLLQALRQGLPRTWLFYAAATALGIYTHVTMLFVTAGQFLIYLWVLVARRRETWPGRWAGLFIGFGFAALLTFQLFALVMPQVLGGMGREASVVEAWKNPLWTLLEVARGLQISFAGSVMAVGALAVFGAGMVGYARTQPVVIHLLVIPSFICVALVVGLGHHLWPRFFFFAFGFAALVAVRGVTVLGEWAIRLLKVSSVKPAWTGIALGVGLAFFSAISIPAAYGPKQDYAGAIDFVETAKGPGDVIATTGLATFPYEKFYKVDWEDAEDLETLSALRSRAKQMWLVYTFPTVLRSVSPQVMASIERDFRIVKQFGGTVGDGTVFVAVAGHE